MGLRQWIEDIKFSIQYDTAQMAKRNEAKYGSDLPDCCTANRKENERRSTDSKSKSQ